MKVIKSHRIQNTVNLEIEEEHERMLAERDNVITRLSKKVTIPGFRQGKVPKNIFEKYYGPDKVTQEALTEVINSSYSDAVKELGLKVIDFPKDFDIPDMKENQPFRFKCSVDVEPEIKLGKYKGIKVKKTEYKIEEKDVENSILQIRDSFAEYLPTNLSCEKEDIIRCSLKVKIEGQEYRHWTRNHFALKIGIASFGPDFDTHIINLKAGEEKHFSVDYPDSFPNKDVASKKGEFSIKIEEVRRKTLPECLSLIHI